MIIFNIKQIINHQSVIIYNNYFRFYFYYYISFQMIILFITYISNKYQFVLFCLSYEDIKKSIIEIIDNIIPHIEYISIFSL